MKRVLLRSLLLLIVGALISFTIAIGAALIANQPPASSSRAKEWATALVMREPNPTKPIWPQRIERGRFTTFETRYPPNARPGQTPDPYIELHIWIGFPLRFLHSQFDYAAGGWKTRVGTFDLMATPSTPQGGVKLMRELPRGVNVWALLCNSAIFAVAIFLPAAALWAVRGHVRKRHSQCPRCGYPVGTSPVCTECGARLSLG